VIQLICQTFDVGKKMKDMRNNSPPPSPPPQTKQKSAAAATTTTKSYWLQYMLNLVCHVIFFFTFIF